MNKPSASTPTLSDKTDSERRAIQATTNLRNALRFNAAFSIISGLTGVFFSSWVTNQLGLTINSGPTIVRIISAGLLAFAATLIVASTTKTKHVLLAGLLAAIGDLQWVALTVGVIAFGAFSTAGAIIATVIGVIVASFAFIQLQARAEAKPAGAYSNKTVVYK